MVVSPTHVPFPLSVRQCYVFQFSNAYLCSCRNPKSVALADRIDGMNHPALWIHRDPRRYYPEETLASQTLGFVDASGTGRQGLEAALDEYLRGGTLLVQRRRD